MSLFAYNLAKCGRAIKIYDRNEKIINGKSTIVFSNERDDNAIIKTLKGVTVFDSTNTERVATHKLLLFYRADVGAEQWVLFNSKYIKILTAENCCEGDSVLKLMCTERGDDSLPVNMG